jgi:glutaredoxin
MILKALREGLGRLVVLVDHLTRPAPMQRSPAEQEAVAAAATKLALYQFYACPFCIKTRRALHRLNLPVALRDAQNDPVSRAELESGGGKIQVPCLRIEEPDGARWLYESKAIIPYLEGRFGTAQPAPGLG